MGCNCGGDHAKTVIPANNAKTVVASSTAVNQKSKTVIPAKQNTSTTTSKPKTRLIIKSK